MTPAKGGPIIHQWHITWATKQATQRPAFVERSAQKLHCKRVVICNNKLQHIVWKQERVDRHTIPGGAVLSDYETEQHLDCPWRIFCACASQDRPLHSRYAYSHHPWMSDVLRNVHRQLSGMEVKNNHSVASPFKHVRVGHRISIT
jgi:hypothetical protein